MRANAGRQASESECERGPASARGCETVLASSSEIEKCEPTGGRANASQQVDERERASVKEFWRAPANATECERVRASASQRTGERYSVL